MKWNVPFLGTNGMYQKWNEEGMESVLYSQL